MTDDESVIVDLLASEIGTKDQPMELVLRPVTVFQIVGALQLTLRHPHVPADIRLTCQRLIQGAREYFFDCPTVLDVIERGDRPEEDR